MTSTAMPYVLGNWKMNLDIERAMTLSAHVAEVADAAAGAVGVGIAPPALWIPSIALQSSESNLLIGAQDVSPYKEGAYTGDISAEMLAPWCAFTLVGHSERRQHHHETDDLVRAKLDAAIAAGMAVVLCVGETAPERDAGEVLAIVEREVTTATSHLDAGQLQSLLVAYEPVWAIGTGKTATADDAQQMAAHIRALLARIDEDVATGVPILYGGSVKPENAAEIFAGEDVDGALVGGASLDADDFTAIIEAAAGS